MKSGHLSCFRAAVLGQDVVYLMRTLMEHAAPEARCSGDLLE